MKIDTKSSNIDHIDHIDENIDEIYGNWGILKNRQILSNIKNIEILTRLSTKNRRNSVKNNVIR